MGNLSDALDLVVEDADRCFTTKRKTPRSRVEVVETSFDHALTVLKLYELTGDSQYLQRWMNYVFENAFFDECGVRWNFSPLVTDKPADADSTAMNLLYLTVAKNQGVDFDPRYSASSNLAQFKDLVSELGGVETFFGLKRDVDPIVNTTLAFLYHLNPASDEQRKSITNYLRKQTMQLLGRSKFSKYYGRGTYFAERMAKLAAYNPEILDRPAEQVLDTFLQIAEPKNALEAALLSIAASYRGLYTRAIEFNRELERTQKKNGLWHFGTLYTQRTPRFNYGCERLTTLFALEALKLVEDGVTIVKN